ncbi:putative ankyrin repeat protein RF_0381 [Saccostrea echinata]|uniref:putative ankyrin repeat protein RF_0381 n=1 Tax=Saccostrea echinata TaxID=191078 RepID=UPI002A8042C3|nr:putative ankyrin repeat protein RF_0381 [Saccostrea echinata]
MVKFLLTIIIYNKQRYEALNQATLMNHEKIVRILLDEGVTPDAKSCFCAIQNGNKDIVMQFINADLDLFEFSESRHPFYYKRSVSILAESCLWERLELISLLLKISPGLCNVKNESGHHTIHFVAYAGATDALKALITEHKCDPYLKTDRETSILHCSCQNGKLQTAKYIISQFPDLLCAEHNKNLSALHYAAWGGNIELLKILLDKGLDISSRTNDGKTALHKCCVNGKKDMCEYLVNTYPNLIDTTDNEGHSALHVVAWGGNIDLFNLFLDKGLDINKTRNDGKTVLQLCCMNGKINMCKFLVNTYPYLVDVINKTGGNVLHDAAWGGNINLFKFFLGKGLDINRTRNDGKTVLHKCCLNGKVDMCKYLCNTYPQLIDIIDNDGENALHTAAWRGNIDLLMFLSEKDLDINRTRNDGKTVLHLCCRNGRMEMCKYLVNKYPNLLEVTNSYGHNALHDAALGGNIDLFKFLADKDFDINRTRNDGKNVLHLSCLNGKMEMCKYLVYTYPYLLEVVDTNGENALEAAVGNSNIDLLKFLLGKGLDNTKTRNDGKTVLHQCCWNGKIDICKYLVNTNPQLLEVIDNDGHNVLHDAASGGNIDVLKFLIEKGLDINSTNNKGKTVLHLCCVTGKLYMCKYLVKTYPYLLNFVDNNGNTALHSAACRGDIDLIMFLLEEGLNINSIRNDGKNVLHMCCMNGMIDTCKYLVNTYPYLLAVKDKDGHNTLHATAGSGNIDLLKFLLEKGLDINSTRNDGKAVLHLCCMNSMTDMCIWSTRILSYLMSLTMTVRMSYMMHPGVVTLI